jgi:tRNA(fMet)-specific endonuclease VapC
VNYLLDTHACIALINGRPVLVRAKFQTAAEAGDKFFVSSIALFELWYGVAKSSRREFNWKRLEAEISGAIRADLEAMGKPIGAYDLLIVSDRRRTTSSP